MMSRAVQRVAAATAVAGAGAGLAWVWRHQGELAMRRPLNEWTFTHMDRLMPTETVTRSGPVRPLPYRPAVLDVAYEWRGRRRTLEDLHASTLTTAFVVLHRGAIVHESFPGRFASPATRFQLFSLTKSVTSMLIGIALAEGSIASLDDPVVRYRPDLAGSAYDGPTVEHLLQMSSGVGDLEDWTLPDALINRFEQAVTSGRPVLEVIRSAPRVCEPGVRFNYSTLDSHVLGWVLEAATGMSLARYAAERLWSRIGAEHDAFYFLTRGRPRTALGGGSLNAAARDLARLGLLMARSGQMDGIQVLDSGWVERSRSGAATYLDVGRLGPSGAPHYGYANQWWTLGGERRAFTGLGVHGQYLWVDPEADVVIAKTSAWPTPDDTERDGETVAALTALTDRLAALTDRPTG
ncbi:serine hydrolase domain-containing protein [Streptomyces sp. NPDC014861]|uniref:serine hydrolase domain-containing protein n=1 Tax=Streptomyces sp. NPDC014861 TaxID=3364923 RepID=UPI0036F62342